MDGNIVTSTEYSEVCLRGATPNTVKGKPTLVTSWRQQAQRLHREAQVFYFAFKHPRVHWYAKLVVACAAGYVFSPIQFIPSFIPVIGFLDDFLILFLGVKLLEKIIPPGVMTECRALAEAAETRRKEEIRSTAAVIALVAIALVWLLSAVIGGALMAAYFPHALKP
jgi:uncharacterized membrane protein YkvA (DUF1232 family)